MTDAAVCMFELLPNRNVNPKVKSRKRFLRKTPNPLRLAAGRGMLHVHPPRRGHCREGVVTMQRSKFFPVLASCLAVFGLLLVSGVGSSAGASSSGGTITWAKPDEAQSLDPHTDFNGNTWKFFFPVYDTLVTTGETLDLQPGIAESWEQTSPTTYVFQLRKNAAFSNGRPVVASDVVGSLERVLDPDTGSWWANALGAVSEIVAEGDHVVRIELEKPHTQLLSALAHVSTAIMPMEEYAAGTFDPTKELMGSGPFMVTEHLQDQSWTYEANPHYWGEGLPVADELKILIVLDEAARIAALRDGRADIGTFVNPDLPALLEGDENITVVTQETASYYNLDVNALSEQSPFTDIRVRQAMNLALDREEISRVALGGMGAVDYPLPRTFPSSKVCVDVPSYSGSREERLESARALMSEAGAEGVEIDLLTTSALPSLIHIAQVIKQQLADIDMNANILQLGYAEWIDAVWVRGEFDLNVTWLSGYGDPAIVLGSWNPEKTGWNAHYLVSDPELNDKIAEAAETPSGDERDALFAEICALIDDGANMVALVNKNSIIAYRNDRVEVNIHPAEGYEDELKYIEEFARIAP